MANFAPPCSKLVKIVMTHTSNACKSQTTLLGAVMHAMRAKLKSVMSTCATRLSPHALNTTLKILVFAAKGQTQRLIAATIVWSVVRTRNLPRQDTIIVSSIFVTTFIFTALTRIILRTIAERWPIMLPSAALCALTAIRANLKPLS